MFKFAQQIKPFIVSEQGLAPSLTTYSATLAAQSKKPRSLGFHNTTENKLKECRCLTVVKCLWECSSCLLLVVTVVVAVLSSSGVEVAECFANDIPNSTLYNKLILSR